MSIVQIMIHIASPYIDGTNYCENVRLLFVRTLSPISNLLFMTSEQAYKTYKTCKHYTFDSCYDATPGMRFNNQFSGDFIRNTLELFDK